jgi:hypothetical protein
MTNAVPATVTAGMTRVIPSGDRVSPFVEGSRAETTNLQALLDQEPDSPSFIMNLLRNPAAIAGQLTASRDLDDLIIDAVGLIAFSAALFVVIAGPDRGMRAALGSIVYLTIRLLAAVLATLGTVYGTSLVLGARVPLGRLIATVVTATAGGALMLAALAPMLHVFWTHDALWTAPVATGVVFFIAGTTAGARLYQLLRGQAEQLASGPLTPEDASRVYWVVRLGLIALVFNSALAFFYSLNVFA